MSPEAVREPSARDEKAAMAVKPHARILVALDSSDHANAALRSGLALAALNPQAVLTGVHVFAAKLHDRRFRQMEGGLPEQFREEEELERQRVVHEDLITRGLSIISDSYLDQAENACRALALPFRRCSREGKNYRELALEANSGAYDLLVLGSLGLGATAAARLGTVARRVSRRANIDTLVIKEPNREVPAGPIVVAVDGSPKSFGGLVTALHLAQSWSAPIKVVAAFDPYYHYVAFNRIAGVLSEQAGKVFRFKEQEKLHEEIIDSGLARIYQSHLGIAAQMAKNLGVEVETELLAGKPQDAIAQYVRKRQASLLVLGKLGIHADAELDIGGNAEQLLESVDCAVWLSSREYVPEIDLVSELTVSWTHEAEAKMERVPSFVRNMARMAILRYAQERGHTVITQKIVDEATAALMPRHAEESLGEVVAAHDAGELRSKEASILRWSEDATSLLRGIEDLAVRGNLSMRAEKKAREDKSPSVEARHLRFFLDAQEPKPDAEVEAGIPEPSWHAAALARLMRVPEGFMRDGAKRTIETYARENGQWAITLEVAEAGLERAREAMEERLRSEKKGAPRTAGKCPFAHGAGAKPEPDRGGGRGESA